MQCQTVLREPDLASELGPTYNFQQTTKVATRGGGRGGE